ncbi:hypothetical protein BGZ68_000930 [Mortierella alpina]|nr:hypothetical protein BGZ68_000930 [Mortierella alpina]
MKLSPLITGGWCPKTYYLMAKFNAHINIEICSTVITVKYLLMYVFNGHDRADMAVADGTADDNEMQQAATQQAGNQLTLFELPVPQRALDRLATAALNWIIQSMLPFSALDSPSFREMIQSINPQVRMPCSATFVQGWPITRCT